MENDQDDMMGKTEARITGRVVTHILNEGVHDGDNGQCNSERSKLAPAVDSMMRHTGVDLNISNLILILIFQYHPEYTFARVHCTVPSTS